MHLAGVGFVIVAGKVNKAVENEDFYLSRKRMSLFEGLAARGFTADGDVAHCFFLALVQVYGRKGKHIRRLVFAAEAAIEIAEDCVCGKQNGDMAAESDGGLGFSQEARQSARGGQTEIAGGFQRNLPSRRS